MESVTLHYLKAWNRLINSCFLAQIPAETRLSIHDSPFFAHEQDTVGTFPAPPDPTGKVPAFSITYVTKPEVLHKFVAVKRQFSFVRFYSFFIIAV